MPPSNLPDLPVELFEKILEDLGIPDILCLKLINRQTYRIICCSSTIKYRVDLFLADLEDGNYYSLAERQQFLRSYQSNWDSVIPQKTTKIPVPDHGTYELAGGVYGLVPRTTPNSLRFYRLPSISRGIEMEEWTIEDLDFSIDDFTMECAYDLLAAFAFKTGHVKVHLLKLSDGKPHPRARKPLLEYDIPLDPTGDGWRIEIVIWENKLGCLFTSAFGNEFVDNLVVWDWTTGDLAQVLSQCGNHSFTFLDDNTIVAGRSTKNASPSLSFFTLSGEQPTNPFLVLAFPDGNSDDGKSWRIQLNLGIPIRHGPELRVRVPFVINPSEQMLFVSVFYVDHASGITGTSRSIAVRFSTLRQWARTDASLVGWRSWEHSTEPVSTGNPYRSTFSMGSRFVLSDLSAFVEAIMDELPVNAGTSIALVYNLGRCRRMRAEWDPSGPHCAEIPGVWNTVVETNERGYYRRAIQTFEELPLDALMTEDNLIMVDMDQGLGDTLQPSLTVLSF